MALTAEDPHQCPSDLGQTWTYRERKGQQNVWLEAGGGMEVICNQGNLNRAKFSDMSSSYFISSGLHVE